MRKKESLKGKRNEKEEKKNKKPQTDQGQMGVREREGESEQEEVTFLECGMGYGEPVIACWCIRACACVSEPVFPGTDRWSISGDGL